MALLPKQASALEQRSTPCVMSLGEWSTPTGGQEIGLGSIREGVLCQQTQCSATSIWRCAKRPT